jgi:hypothetical protein
MEMTNGKRETTKSDGMHMPKDQPLPQRVSAKWAPKKHIPMSDVATDIKVSCQSGGDVASTSTVFFHFGSSPFVSF